MEIGKLIRSKVLNRNHFALSHWSQELHPENYPCPINPRTATLYYFVAYLVGTKSLIWLANCLCWLNPTREAPMVCILWSTQSQSWKAEILPVYSLNFFPRNGSLAAFFPQRVCFLHKSTTNLHCLWWKRACVNETSLDWHPNDSEINLNECFFLW